MWTNIFSGNMKKCNTIIVDNRCIDKSKKHKPHKYPPFGPCKKCQYDYINEITNSKENNIILNDNWKYRNKYNRPPKEYLQYSLSYYTINTLYHV